MATSGSSGFAEFIETGYAKRAEATQSGLRAQAAGYRESVGAEFSLVPVVFIQRDVVEVRVAQFDVVALVLAGYRLKRIRSANRRIRGSVQRLFSRVALDDGLVARHASIAHDFKGQHNDAALTQCHRLRHDREPVALDGHVHALEIAGPVQSLRRGQHFQAAESLSASAGSSPAPALDTSTTRDSATVRARRLRQVAHRLIHRRGTTWG